MRGKAQTLTDSRKAKAKLVRVDTQLWERFKLSAKQHGKALWKYAEEAFLEKIENEQQRN